MLYVEMADGHSVVCAGGFVVVYDAFILGNASMTVEAYMTKVHAGKSLCNAFVWIVVCVCV